MTSLYSFSIFLISPVACCLRRFTRFTAATTLNILKTDEIFSFQAPVVWRHIVKVAIWIITVCFNKILIK